MEDLRAWRHRWEQAQKIEARLIKPRPMAEKVARYLEMRATFEPRLAATREDYRRERMEYLGDLQERLGKMAALLRGHTSSDTKARSDPA